MTRDEAAWPRDPLGYRFILRSLDDAGRQAFPSAWTGAEDLTPPYKLPNKRPVLPAPKPLRRHPADDDRDYQSAIMLLAKHDDEVKVRLKNAAARLQSTGDASLSIPGIRIETNFDNTKAKLIVDPTDEDWARAVTIDQPRYEADLASFRRAKVAVEALVRSFEAGKAATFYRPLAGGELHAIPRSWWRGEVVDRRFAAGQLNPSNPFDSRQRGAYIFVETFGFSTEVARSPIIDETLPVTDAAGTGAVESANINVAAPIRRIAESQIEPEFKKWRDQQTDGYVPTEKEDIAYMKQFGVSRKIVRDDLRKQFPRRSRGEKKGS
jgi:hypothetical protein